MCMFANIRKKTKDIYIYIYMYIYIYIRLLTTGGDSLGLYQTTHDWWRYLRALPDYSRLVAIP